jgi:hypothetical protein
MYRVERSNFFWIVKKQYYVSAASNLKKKNMKAEQETHFTGFISLQNKNPITFPVAGGPPCTKPTHMVEILQNIDSRSKV